MKGNKKVLLAIAGGLVLLQLMRTERNVSGNADHRSFVQSYNVPGNVGLLFSTSCFDCHSNTTTYSWYTSVQPVGWWMESHIKEGKRALNFDEFETYSHRRQLSKLKSMAGTIEDKKMPLASYTFVHHDSRLSNQEQKIMIDWIHKTLDSLEQNIKQ